MKSFGKIFRGLEYFHWDFRKSQHTKSIYSMLSLWKKRPKFSQFLFKHCCAPNQEVNAKAGRTCDRSQHRTAHAQALNAFWNSNCSKQWRSSFGLYHISIIYIFLHSQHTSITVYYVLTIYISLNFLLSNQIPNIAELRSEALGIQLSHTEASQTGFKLFSCCMRIPQ